MRTPIKLLLSLVLGLGVAEAQSLGTGGIFTGGGGGSTSPCGSTNDLQVNNGGSFGCDSGHQLQWDLTNHKGLGILANGSTIDAPVKVGTLAVSAAGAIGLTSSGFATGMTENDTNFPSVRYPFAFVDGNTCGSITNGGANNVICGSFMAAKTISNSIVPEYEGIGVQSLVQSGVTLGTEIDFDSAPGGPGTITQRYGWQCYDAAGPVTNHDTCFWQSANWTHGGTRYFIEQQDSGTLSYFVGKVAIGAQTNPVDFLEVDNGNLRFNGGKGQHFNTQAANNDKYGTCVFAAATTCSYTYVNAFTNTPVVLLTPVNPGAVTFTLTATSNTGFTITGSTSNSLTVNYSVGGNPN